LLVLVSIAPASAQTRTIYFELLAPADVPHVVPLAPGQSFQFSFSLRSRGSAGVAILRVDVLSRAEALSQYTFVSSDPSRCRVPEVEQREYSLRLAFGVGPLVPEEVVACSYTVTRSLSSVDDLGFALCDWLGESCHLASFRVGTLPRMELEVVPATGTLPDGTQLISLVARNNGPVAVTSRVVATSCAEFGGGWFFPVAFTLDTDFPGACRSTYGEGCISFGGQHYSSYGFDMGPVAPGNTASCLVRVRGAGGALGSSRIGVGFLDDRAWLRDGALAFDPGFVFDPSTMNGGGVISFGALPPVPAIPVPVAPWAVVLTALLCMSIGAFAVQKWRRVIDSRA
jgi:hypothetical protein